MPLYLLLCVNFLICEVLIYLLIGLVVRIKRDNL